MPNPVGNASEERLKISVLARGEPVPPPKMIAPSQIRPRDSGRDVLVCIFEPSVKEMGSRVDRRSAAEPKFRISGLALAFLPADDVERERIESSRSQWPKTS